MRTKSKSTKSSTSTSVKNPAMVAAPQTGKEPGKKSKKALK